ncbi:MAG: hypothetical protein HY901_11720 [Deltaproteobacteria bacterium]|nr:hypothetical protein [Deltaproteobacteria bacterium]
MRWWIATLCLAAWPAVGLAQRGCPYGLVAVDGLHCCWPQQSFSAERSACVGMPQCPAGLALYGETCVPGQVVAQPDAPLPAEPVAVPLPPPLPSEPAQDPPMQGYLPPPLQPLQGFPVHFEAKRDGTRFAVSVDEGPACQTPCDLVVTPGKHRVRVLGDASFRQNLRFPAAPSVVKIDKRKGGRLALAIVGLAVGIPVALVGVEVALIGAISSLTDSRDRSLFGDVTTRQALVVGGLIAAGAGITFAAVGAGVGFGTMGRNKARLHPAGSAQADEPPALQLMGLAAAPTQGGAMVGASFAF